MVRLFIHADASKEQSYTNTELIKDYEIFVPSILE